MLPYSAQVSGTKTTVQAVPCRIAAYHFMNTTAAIAYVQVFNKLAADVTVGTTAADLIIPLAANGSAIMPALEPLRNQISLNTGCVIACTTTRTGSTGAAVDCLIWADTNL